MGNVKELADKRYYDVKIMTGRVLDRKYGPVLARRYELAGEEV